MSLGRRADYAIRATFDLAKHRGSLRKAREIGAAMSIPASFLPQILGQLVHAGFVSSTAGPRGGYGLLVDPAELSLLDVVTAVEGPVGDAPCILRGGACGGPDTCVVHGPWSRAREALYAELAAARFAALTDDAPDGEAPDHDAPDGAPDVAPDVAAGPAPSSSRSRASSSSSVTDSAPVSASWASRSTGA
jgi:Rrf2 family transcriptional regulator, iron-sulfur cluster assembly transcription factor